MRICNEVCTYAKINVGLFEEHHNLEIVVSGVRPTIPPWRHSRHRGGTWNSGKSWVRSGRSETALFHVRCSTLVFALLVPTVC